MSSLGLATPHALCPRCLLHRGFLLTRTQTPSSSSLRCVGDSVGGWLHAQRNDAARSAQSARRHYRSSPSKFNNKHREVVTDSLQETLDLHRSLNRQLLIRRVRTETPQHISPSNFRPHAVIRSVSELSIANHEEGLEENYSEDPHGMVMSAAEPTPTTGLPIRIVSYDPRRKSKSARRLHPFDPESNSQRVSGHKRENMCWVVENGQPVQYPWMEHLPSEQEQQLDGLSQLNAEIKAFEKFITPSSQETEISERVLSDITHLIAGKLGTSIPVCLGSRSTGMSLTHSDIDILIPIADPERPADGGRGPSATRPKAVRSHLDYLRKVDNILKASGDFRHVLSIRARVPIVSAVHGRTGLELQLQCGDKGTGTPASQEYVKNYLAEFPSLRAIYAILRMALETRGLFGGSKRSIGTYGLTMMIVVALKLGDGTYHRHDLGKQLLHVLETYSNFDFAKKGIAAEPACFFRKAYARGGESRKPTHIDGEEGGEEQDYDANREAYMRGRRHISKMSMKENRSGGRICIQDPADYTNDLGRTCDMTPKIRHLFKAVLKDLRAGIEKCDGNQDNHETDTTADGRETDPEKPLLGFALGANYEDLELARDKVVYGSWFK